MEYNKVTVAVRRVATMIDEVVAALRNPGQDKNETEFLNRYIGNLDQASNQLRDAIDDPLMEDVGETSESSANENPDYDDERDAKEAKQLKKTRVLGTDTTTMAEKPSEVRKGGELTSPANDSTTL